MCKTLKEHSRLLLFLRHLYIASLVSCPLFRLKDTDFPVQFLPAVVAAPSPAGSLKVSWQGIPPGTPVCVGMGDLQCSILATNPSPSDASE